MSELWKFSVAVSEPVSDEYPSILRGDFPDTIQQAKKMGYDAVEIHTGEPASFPLEEVRELCNREKIDISAISSGMSYSRENLSVISENTEIREKARKRFLEYIDMASALDCMLIMGLMRGQLEEPSHYNKSCEALKKYLVEMLAYAEQKKVVIVFEAINRYENNFLRSTKEVVDFVRSVNNDFLKAHLDTYHMNIEENNLINALYYAGNQLGYIHFSDSNRKMPGFGHIDFLSLTRALYHVGYKGYLTIESVPYPESKTVAEFGIAYLKDLEQAVLLGEK